MRVHLQNAVDIRRGFRQIAGALGLAGKLQPCGREAGDSLDGFGVDAGTNLVHERLGILV